MSTTANYAVSRGIPLPPRQYETKAAASKYPLLSMGVDDSFFIPEGDVDAKNKNQIFSTVSGQANRARRILNNPDLKFTTRKVEGGFRVWRIK